MRYWPGTTCSNRTDLTYAAAPIHTRMTAIDITQENYQVHYDKDSATISCRGSLRLRDLDYKPILELFYSAVETTPDTLTLDLRELRFLNSAGIHTLLKLVLRVREREASQVVVQGSAEFPWQKKSLKNLQRLLPQLRLEID